MNLKNLKITTRLIISSATFLLPIVMMLVLVISIANTAIQRGRKEQWGISCLYPIADIYQAIPLFLRISFELDSADRPQVYRELAKTVDALERYYRNGLPAGGGSGEQRGQENSVSVARGGHRYISVNTLREDLDILLASDKEKLPRSYAGFIRDLRALIAYIGDVSGLMANPEGGSFYLGEVSLLSLPQVQDRIIEITNQIQIAAIRESFSQESRKELESDLILLSMAEHPRLISSLETVIAETLESEFSAEAQAIASALDTYRVSLRRLMESLQALLVSNNPERVYPSILNASSQAEANIRSLWTAVLNQLETMIQNRIKDETFGMIRSLVLALVTSLAAFIIIIMTAASITKSTNVLKKLFRNLENNDLSVTVEVRSADEMGELMIAFNRFLEVLRAAFISFGRNASMVSASVYDLSASAKEITATANEQFSSVAEIVSTMEGNKNLSEQVALKTQDVADLAVKTQEFSQRGAELWNVNQEIMQGIRNQNGKIIDEIKNLADMLNQIDETIVIIDTIADQTKLIAFNASLEASGSGEAGARFSVVAGEIRRFADNVVDSTGEIKQKIGELQTAAQVLIVEANNGSKKIDSGYERMAEQKDAFENIVNISQNVATRSQQISNLSKQQELASAQIFIALKEISAGVNQFVTATASTSKIADNLNTMSAELRETVEKYQTKSEKE
jgi:methyl-accepting chemotaxis protein